MRSFGFQSKQLYREAKSMFDWNTATEHKPVHMHRIQKKKKNIENWNFTKKEKNIRYAMGPMFDGPMPDPLYTVNTHRVIRMNQVSHNVLLCIHKLNISFFGESISVN